MSYRAEHNPEEIVAAIHRITERSRRREHRFAVAAAIFAVVALIATVTAWYLHGETRRTLDRDLTVHHDLERAVDTLDRVMTRIATETRTASAHGDRRQLVNLLTASETEFTAFLERDYANDPDNLRRNAELYIQLSASYLALGAPEQSLRAAHSARELLDRLPAGAGEDRNQYAATLIAEGDALSALEDNAAATAVYAEALSIREGLSDGAPDDIALRRDLALGYERHGQALARLGESELARERLEQALATRQALAAAMADDTAMLESLAVAHSNLGDHELAAGRPDSAVTAYQEALDLFDDLLAVDGERSEWQDGRAIHLARIGRARVADGTVSAGLEALDQAADIYRGLLERSPGNVDWQERLAETLDWSGEARLSNNGLPGARSAFTEALDIRRQLHEREPANSAHIRAFADALVALARVDRAENLDEMARLRVAEAIELRRELVAATPDSIGGVTALARTLATGAEFGIAPRTHLQEALDILRELSDDGRLGDDHAPLAEDIRQRLASLLAQ